MSAEGVSSSNLKWDDQTEKGVIRIASQMKTSSGKSYTITLKYSSGLSKEKINNRLQADFADAKEKAAGIAIAMQHHSIKKMTLKKGILTWSESKGGAEKSQAAQTFLESTVNDLKGADKTILQKIIEIFAKYFPQAASVDQKAEFEKARDLGLKTKTTQEAGLIYACHQALTDIKDIKYNKPIVEWDGRGYTVSDIYLSEDKNGVKTTRFTLTAADLGNDPYLKQYGGSKEVEINDFPKDVYNGPKEEDFTTRMQLTFDTAVKAAGSNEQLKTKLTDLHKKYQKKVLNELKDVKITNYEQLEAYDKRVNPGFGIRRLFGTRRPNDPMKNGAKLAVSFRKEAQKMVEEAKLKFNEEDEVISRNRPIIFNLFTLNSGKKTGTFMHMQWPGLKKTQPSLTINKPGLVNYVFTAFGKLENDQVEILAESIRHGRYPPIGLQEDEERLRISCQNCRQGIETLAKRMVAADPKLAEKKSSKENPLVVPLRTMMLITPHYYGQLAVEKAKGSPNEYTMLVENDFALRMNQQPMEVDLGDGKKMWVKADLSWMNIGVNVFASVEAGKRVRGEVHVEDRMNTAGAIRFSHDVQTYILDKYRESAVAKELLAMQTALGKYKKQLDHAVKGARSDLDKVYPELAAKFEELKKKEDFKDDVDPETIKTGIETLKKEALRQENAIHAANQVYLKEYQKLFKGHKDAISKAAEDNLDNPASAIVVDFLRAQEAFQGKQFLTKKDTHTFQTLYIGLYARMGVPVDYFCKSAEDRTGRQEDLVNEREAYHALTGRYPTPEQARDQAFVKSISMPMHQYSCSQNNTRENSGARGLQNAAFGTALPKYIEKYEQRSAKMAKD